MACRSLVQALVPRPDVAPLLQERFVALAGDADEPEPEVHRLVFRLPSATTLPFVLIADADGKYVAGAAGAQDPASFKALLEGALS